MSPQEEVGSALDQRWMLCLLLILERTRSTASKWHAYIDILPTRYGDPSPVLFQATLHCCKSGVSPHCDWLTRSMCECRGSALVVHRGAAAAQGNETRRYRCVLRQGHTEPARLARPPLQHAKVRRLQDMWYQSCFLGCLNVRNSTTEVSVPLPGSLVALTCLQGVCGR